jgi:hypothetical protein
MRKRSVTAAYFFYLFFSAESKHPYLLIFLILCCWLLLVAVQPLSSFFFLFVYSLLAEGYQLWILYLVVGNGERSSVVFSGPQSPSVLGLLPSNAKRRQVARVVVV